MRSFFYPRDDQTNVIALLDNSGAAVVKYRYDAWGNCITTVVDPNASAIANLNPFRYRSYYFDTETGFYFLKTRYYDPEIGRFMTIDDIRYLDPESINGLNLYAYCLNNPILGYDPNGTWDWGTFFRVLGSTLAIAGGFALCFVPGAEVIGVGLIVMGVGGMLGGTISIATGNGFNYGWDIGTIIGGLISLAILTPQLWNLTLNLSIPFLNLLITSAGCVVPEIVTVSVTVPVGAAIATIADVGILYMAYESKKAAPRIKSNSKKKAYDKAFQKGGKKEPIYHPDGKFGPHYHPADPKFKHWHYYFSLILAIFGITADTSD